MDRAFLKVYIRWNINLCLRILAHSLYDGATPLERINLGITQLPKCMRYKQVLPQSLVLLLLTLPGTIRVSLEQNYSNN